MITMWMPTRRILSPLQIVLFLLLSLDAIYGKQQFQPQQQQRDICSTCNCTNETLYKKISCDFLNDEDYQLDNQFTFPDIAISLNVRLGDHARLTIKNGFFFAKNKFNSFVVSGQSRTFDRSANRVDMESFALENIGGNFPEITFVSLNAVVLHEKSLDARRNLEINLSVESVWSLLVKSEVFGVTSYNATFNDIGDLQLADGVLKSSNFHLTRPKIIINQASIKALLPLRGTKLTELKIANSQIELITESAFSTREINTLALDNVTIQSIHSKSFSYGILVQNLAVTNCKITEIQSEAIKELGIGKILIDSNTINSIESNAIDFVGSYVRFVNNEVNMMKPRWFSVSNWNTVYVYNNTFGGFDTMHLENPSDEAAECTLQHNSFTKLVSNSFKHMSEKCQFTEILLKQNCACNFESWLSGHFLKQHDRKKLKKEAFCSLEASDSLTKCFEAQTIKFQDYYDEICKRTKKLRCERVKVKVDKVEANFIDPKLLITEEFDWWEYKNHFIIGGAVLFVLIFFLCIVKLTRRPKRDLDYSRGFENTDLVQLNPSDGPPSYQVTVNQDFVIIKQTLDLMRQKQPKEKYELVDQKTRRLLYENIDEYEKVKVIGDIVQTISECDNTGDDFVAFTDILYKYLAADVIPRTLPRPEGLYAEPTVLNERPVAAAKRRSENIYAEPIVAAAALASRQQGKAIVATAIPIMTANYSAPIDSHTSSNNNNLYSEPIIMDQKIGIGGSSTFKPKVVTPYAISQTLDVPTSSTQQQNLPDILDRQQAGTSAEPFRINRSPTSNRLIPEYTIPSTSHKLPQRLTTDNMEDWSDDLTDGSTNSNTSSYSGSSKQTVKIDEIVQ